MKAKLKIYNNGVSAQRNNRRVVVSKDGNNFVIEIYSKSGGKFTEGVQMRGDFYVGNMTLSAETFELLQIALGLYFKHHTTTQGIA